MNSSVSCAVMPDVYTPDAPPSDRAGYTTYLMPEMASSTREVEKLLHYNFNRVSLLEEALTHSSSSSHSTSNYERLEFIGDAALGLAVAKELFSAYPDLDPGQLTRLRIANVSNEKLARSAVKRGLHRYIRLNVPGLHKKIRNFVMAVEQEDVTVIFRGENKPPKILADIVESVAAAVYIDCGFDLEASWPIFKRLLEPLVTLDLVQERSQPVKRLPELCKRDGKKVEITKSKEGRRKKIVSVCVDGKLIASASAKQWENARIHSPKAASEELSYHTTTQRLSPTSAQELSYNNDDKVGSGMDYLQGRIHEGDGWGGLPPWPLDFPLAMGTPLPFHQLPPSCPPCPFPFPASGSATDYLVHELDGCGEIKGAKNKLRELCRKRMWPKPRYGTEKTGSGHDLRFICSVRIETGTKELLAMGEEKSRRKHAKNSAASHMLLGLQESKYLCL